MSLHQIQITMPIALAELFADQGETDMQPELNVDLLDKTMDHIETLAAFQAEGADLDVKWNQHSWGHEVYDETGATCGTAMCFAGHAAVLAGHRLVRVGQSRYLGVEGPNQREGGVSVEKTAAKELGLNMSERSALFAGSNDLEDLRGEIVKIKAGVYR